MIAKMRLQKCKPLCKNSTIVNAMRARAFLFGLNYADDPDARLQGCINDVRNMAQYLGGLGVQCTVYTDDVNKGQLTGLGLLQALNEAAIASVREDLDMVWIHYSGHGTSVRDKSGDEADGMDECLVPTDFRQKGVLPDDYIRRVFSLFNPRTRVIFVFDCCHSGTIGDVRYSWEGPSAPRVENRACAARCKVITISGCLDHQVSMDVQSGGPAGAAGAMTTALLETLKGDASARGNVFALINGMRVRLRRKGFVQVPKLCSSHDLAKDPRFLCTF